MKYFQALQIPDVINIKEYSNYDHDNLFIKQIWIKTNLIDFFHEALFFYNYKISSCCTDQACSIMSVGPSRICFWAIDIDSNDDVDSNLTSAHYYMNRSFNWMYDIFKDISSNNHISSNEFNRYLKAEKMIVKRLFRFYGHCYYSHLKEIKDDESNFSFFYLTMRFFISFIIKYDLLDLFEFEPLKMIIIPFADDSINFDENSSSENIEETNAFLTSDQEDD